MSTHVTGIDHVVILVRHLDASEHQLRTLGFRPTPRGYHSAKMGTANHTVMFREANYFETLGVVADTPLSAPFARILAEREGITAVAFQTDDARAAAADFQAGGFGAGEAVDFARPVDLADGTKEAAFTVARIESGTLAGLEAFVCQHHTPGVTWRPDYLDHENGVKGLAELVGVADDLAAVAASFERIFGPGAGRIADGVLTIETGTVPIRYVGPDRVAERFAGMTAIADARPPYLLGLSFRVADVDATAACLARHGIAAERSASGAVLVAPADACGTVMEFGAAA